MKFFNKPDKSKYSDSQIEVYNDDGKIEMPSTSSNEKKLYETKVIDASSLNDSDDLESINDIESPKNKSFFSKFNVFASQLDKTAHTERKLKQRHIDLIAIGGSIGTALFVTIGSALMRGGCGNLLISFTLHGLLVIYIVTLTIGELICYLPVDSPFITHAGRFVDPAFEVVCGYNFYIMVSLYIPFEITSFNSMIHFWRDDYSPAAAFVPQIVIYIFLNVFAVNFYGESEFFLAIGKVILAVGLLFFTFITMVGGNPQHWAFGFHNFEGIENAFPQYLGTGASAFWAAYLKAVFTEVAPEYLGMVAGEAENPRKVMPRAFSSIIYRLSFFYVLGALSVGILVSHNDPALVNAVTNGAAGANVSPYVIAMQNMSIKVLPDIVNVLCMTSTFSAGNSYVYCSSRALYAMAKRGKAPKIFTLCFKNGVPIFTIILAIGWSCLSLLQLGKSASVALDWMINLCTGCQVMNYFFMMITYLFFYKACKVQGVDRFKMPLQAWTTKYQPYPAFFALFITFVIIMFLGCQAFIPTFDVNSFLYYYLMVFVNIGVFFIYKFWKKTKFIKPEEADLFTGLAEIDEHERKFYATHKVNENRSRWERFLDWIF
jgi:amino acid transporter